MVQQIVVSREIAKHACNIFGVRPCVYLFAPSQHCVYNLGQWLTLIKLFYRNVTLHELEAPLKTVESHWSTSAAYSHGRIGKNANTNSSWEKQHAVITRGLNVWGQWFLQFIPITDWRGEQVRHMRDSGTTTIKYNKGKESRSSKKTMVSICIFFQRVCWRQRHLNYVE